MTYLKFSVKTRAHYSREKIFLGSQILSEPQFSKDILERTMWAFFMGVLWEGRSQKLTQIHGLTENLGFVPISFSKIHFHQIVMICSAIWYIFWIVWSSL